MIIEYEDGKKHYRGTLKVNLKTFIFKEINFEEFQPKKEEKTPEKPKTP